MNRWEKALLIGLILTAVLSMVSFADTCDEIDDRVLRLHILANSDSEDDQRIKLTVRDCLLAQVPELFEGTASREEAVQAAENSMSRVKACVQEALDRQHVTYGFTVEVVDSQYFDQREYEDFTMPAGQYAALRVLLGEGEGKNWWCVMYPPLCGGAAKATMEENFDHRQNKLLSSDGKYEIKFRLYEWLKGMFSKRKR